MKYNNKYWIFAILMITLIGSTLGAPVITWNTPDQNGVQITEYPQKIDIYAYSSSNINSCNITVNNLFYQQTDIGWTNVNYIKELKLASGTYTAIVSCNDGAETTSNRTFLVDDNLTFREYDQKTYLLIFLLIVYGGLLWAWIATKEKVWKFITSTGMILVTLYATTVENNIFMWIPIMIGIALWIDSTLRIISK